MPGPLVVWWGWIVFVVANLIDLALTGRGWDSVVVLVVLAVITGLIYAVAFRPRVITDEDGITVRNPFRDHWIPWGAVGSVVVGESVQLHCSRGPGTDREKVVHSWALYSSRRARVKSGLPPRRSLFQQAAPPSRLPKEAQELLKQSPADHIAGELDLQARLARERGAPAGGLAGSWPWHAFAAALIPAAALLIVLLAH
jgi:hypothetical protein